MNKKVWLRAVLVATATAAATTSFAQEVRILSSSGGPVAPFVEIFERVRTSGARVAIDGPCYSACTLILSMLPRDRICVTRRAVLGFHGARSVDGKGRISAEPGASKIVLATYPEAVRHWIERRGGLTSRLLLLRGRELAAMYPLCARVDDGRGTSRARPTLVRLRIHAAM
jgi:hypothetical protein